MYHYLGAYQISDQLNVILWVYYFLNYLKVLEINVIYLFMYLNPENTLSTPYFNQQRHWLSNTRQETTTNTAETTAIGFNSNCNAMRISNKTKAKQNKYIKKNQQQQTI